MCEDTTQTALQSRRWIERETLELMEKVVALPIGSTIGYEIRPTGTPLGALRSSICARLRKGFWMRTRS